jgi:hypothetical protein
MINSIDKFKMCREFIIMINSDMFKKSVYSYSKFKGGAHVGLRRAKLIMHSMIMQLSWLNS